MGRRVEAGSTTGASAKPEVPSREGMAGAGLEVALEFVGSLAMGKGDVRHEATRNVFCGVRRFTRIVVDQALP